MDAADYEQELAECREWLAGKMGLEEVPDEVWGYVMKLGLVYAAITSGTKKPSAKSPDPSNPWQELEDEAKARLRESLEGTGFVLPPGRDKGAGARAAPHEITVETSVDTLKRAEAYSEVAADMANSHPRVLKFRRKHLRDGLLSDEEARAFFGDQGGPYGTGGTLKRLLELAERLSKTYRWRAGDAAWFVLTGHTPPVRPVEVSMDINNASKYPGRPQTLIPGSSPPRYVSAIPRPRDYHPSTARITVSADAWVGAEEVERAYRDAQRQLLGGDAKASRGARTLAAVKFVALRMREHPGERWKERLRAWNETYPEWRYKDFRGLRQAFERFAYREYLIPNYRPRKKTPYEAYRDDWDDGITNEG